MHESNSKSGWVIWSPIVFFGIIFALDKLLLIPALRDCCTRNRVDAVFSESLNDVMHGLEQMDEARRTGKKIVVNFGSSLSNGFYFIDQIRAGGNNSRSPHLQYMKELEGWYVLNFAYPNATAITDFVRFSQLLDRGIRPDLVLIEFSPATLNPKSPLLHDEIRNTMSGQFALEHGLEIPLDHLWKNLSSRMMVSLRYQPGRPIKNMDLLAQRLQQFYQYNHSTKNPPPAKGVLPGMEDEKRKLTDKIYRGIIDKLFRDYAADPNLTDYIMQIAERSRENRIKLILWNPRLHPEVRSIVFGKTNGEDWNRTVGRLKNAGVIYIDMNHPTALNCNLFIDPIHMDAECFPEILYQSVITGREYGKR